MESKSNLNSQLTRNTIRTISRHSNWPSERIGRTFRETGIYANRTGWSNFIDLALLILGAVFSLAGVILFFAYNWQDLHKFVKLGLTAGAIVILVTLIVFTKFKPLVKNILLSSASVLVGVLFSVFGQIYQTGADAYDFFLGWTVFILIWALVSEFAPLWLILMVLINTTLVLYAKQAGPDWSGTMVCLILFLLNTAVTIMTKLLQRAGKISTLPGWFNKVLGFAAISCITIGVCTGIFDAYPAELYVSVLLAALFYAAAIRYSFQQRSLFYLCIVPLSTIIILCCFLLEIVNQNDAAMYFVLSLLVLLSVSILVSQLIKLTKTWNGIN